ncbi:MAG: hypothetical protein A2W29_02215 [Gemmatimonadetes bacterium RBG_16_66_8]|nr:MAG: hypothetical protein A2W29_02215 [Gemmatimonadetes bacterium RBG_16_66_8]
MPSPANFVAFRRGLLRWFRRRGRPLPWRETRDPYRVLVSEFMLQQTQVSRVVDFYGRFLGRYPSLESVARAGPSTVRDTWDGLGYYRRAENLHRLAQAVVKEYGGRLPDDPEALRRLPGIGRYTAAALASFAHERRVLPVDTNVARVLNRAFGAPKGDTVRARRRMARLADQLLPRTGKSAWAFNQALMDLGATVCVARRPKCPNCPVQGECRTGRRLGGQAGGRTGGQPS